MNNPEFLMVSYFGNPLLHYIYAFSSVIGAIVLGRVLKAVIVARLKVISKKTRTKVDDIVITVIDKSITFVMFVAGFYFGLNFLNIGREMLEVINGSMLIFVTLMVALIVQFVFDVMLENYMVKVAKKTKFLDAQFVHFFRKLGDLLIWVVAVIFAVANLGVNVASLLTGLGIGGVALALGAQETLSSIFSSFSLLSDKPFKTGDWVKIDGNEGLVQEVGLRSTRIVGFGGTELMIPNKRLQEMTIENVARRKTVRESVVLGLDYHTSHEGITAVMKSVEALFKKEKKAIATSNVHFMGFGESSLDLKIVYTVKHADDYAKFLKVRTRINLALKKAVEDAGVKFALPSRAVYMHKA